MRSSRLLFGSSCALRVSHGLHLGLLSGSSCALLRLLVGSSRAPIGLFSDSSCALRVFRGLHLGLLSDRVPTLSCTCLWAAVAAVAATAATATAAPVAVAAAVLGVGEARLVWAKPRGCGI